MSNSRSYKITKVFFAFLVSLIFFACKKEKEPEPVVDPPPPVPIVIPDQITLKVNGVEKKCHACSSSAKSGSYRSTYFFVAGPDEQIFLGGFTWPKPGTYNLIKNQEPLLIYIKNNIYFKAVDGTLNITSIDSSSKGVVNKLVGNFTFATDTTAGVSYTITEGSFNLN